MAVSAAVAKGIEDAIAADPVTPESVVFEWLVVKAFVRAGDREHTRGTAGILEARHRHSNQISTI